MLTCLASGQFPSNEVVLSASLDMSIRVFSAIVRASQIISCALGADQCVYPAGRNESSHALGTHEGRNSSAHPRTRSTSVVRFAGRHDPALERRTSYYS